MTARTACVWPLLWACACSGPAEPAAGATDAAADTTATDTPAADAKFDLDADPQAGQATGATALYDLAGSDWNALPFPNDLRRKTDGKIDLAGFPKQMDGAAVHTLIADYAAQAQGRLDGWSIQPTIYVPFSAVLASKAIEKAVDTVVATAPYFLVDVTPASPTYGQFVPVLAKVSPSKRGQYLQANLLMVQPAWGWPLRPKTAYALVVRRGWKDADGKVLGQPQLLAQAFSQAFAGAAAGSTTGSARNPSAEKLAKLLQPLADLLSSGKLPVPWKDIAAATVFTTGDPAAQLPKMAEWVRSTYSPPSGANVTDWVRVKDEAEYVLYTAKYVGPNFQKGMCPYDSEGGFEWNADGTPKVQKHETLRVALTVPKARHQEQQGLLPIAISAHGTGGNYLSFIKSSGEKIANRLSDKGLAVISIDQPMHGPRCDPPIKDEELDLKTFNFLNLDAGLSGFRQSALDTVYLGRLVREGKFEVPLDIAPNGKKTQFDPNRVHFIGHSQGGLSGALMAAVEPSIRAFVLSGAGAGISLTVMLRKDPGDIAKNVAALLDLDNGELSEFHPVISVVQMLADVTDPLAYGHKVFQRDEGVRPPHVLLTEGLLDKQTPSATSEALAAAIGLDVLAPAVHLNDAMKTRKTQVLPSPQQGNLFKNGFPVTGLVSQWDGKDHFVIFTTAAAAGLYAEFLNSTAATGEASAILP